MNGEGKSKPFTIYQTIEGGLPKQFVLRLDSAVNKNGEAQLRISNSNMGLIVSHQPEYIEGVLAGYKRNIEDVECILCELVDDILQKSKVAERPIPQKGDSWIDRLYAWADENKIPDLHWFEDKNIIGEGGYWRGLPRDKEKLTNLTGLYLNDNQLTSLPAEIGQLTSLSGLSLSDNQLHSLPVEIGRLTNLWFLSLSSNQFTSLPTELWQLANLNVLNLDKNQLTSLPAEISQLTSLDSLSLSDNQLSSLPVEIGQLNLNDLDLRRNLLTSLPTEIGKLNLQFFYLGGNPLTSLPQEIFDMPYLDDTCREWLLNLTMNEASK